MNINMDKIQQVISYLEGQRDLLIEELKHSETPLGPQASVLEIEAMMTRRRLYDLESYIKVIKLLAQSDERKKG